MAEPADSALVTATKLLNDNRSVVYGRTATGQRVVVLPTLPNGTAFVAKTPAGADIAETEVVADTAKAAHVGSANPVGEVIVPVDVATLNADGTCKYARSQLFSIINPTTGALTQKWCYTNIKGMPLAANGTPTTVAAAVDLKDATVGNRKLTAAGEAVANSLQPGPLPGVYECSELQTLYSPYIGWTVTQTSKV